MRHRGFAVILVGVLVAAGGFAGAEDPRPVARPYDDGPAWGEVSYRPALPERAVESIPIMMLTEHILAMQCGNGGFGWPHGDCSQTFHNITGPILLGVLGGYEHSRDGFHLVGVVNGGVYDMTSQYDNGEARFGSFMPYFLMWVARASQNVTFSEHVSNGLFDELAASTYGPNDRDTAGWIGDIQALRTGQWINIRPWELHTLIPAAMALGQPGQAALFEQGVLDGLGTLDRTSPSNVYLDILGVAAGVRGLAFARLLGFPAISAPLHSGVDGVDSLETLAAYLASLQNPDGSWYRHSNLPSPTDSDKETQTTAYAALALLQADLLTAASYAPAYEAARDWLVSLQLPGGGIPSYPGGSENVQVEGEALTAIAAVEALLFLDGFESGTTDLWSSVTP